MAVKFILAFALGFALAAHIAAAQSTGSVPSVHAPKPSALTSPEIAIVEAHKLSQLGKFDEAIAQLEAVAVSQPGAKGLSRELGLAYYKKSDYAKAADFLKKAAAENPSDNEAVQLLGLSYYLAGRPADAIAPLEKIQTWFPSANIDASYILGMCYLQTKDYPRARSSFAKMFGVPPDSAPAYLFAARMLLRSDFGPVAEEYGQKAVALDPKLPLAHQLLGELYTYQSRIPEAIAQFEQELAINPGSAQSYYKLADAYSRIEKFEDAERLLQRSIWLDPSSTGPYILLGKVLGKKGEYALAARALERAIGMDPNNAIPHHLLGQTYRELQLAQKLQSNPRNP